MNTVGEHEDMYTKGVIDEKFGRIIDKMNDWFSEQKDILKRIEGKVDYTNGSVAKVKESLAFWRGAIWVIGGVIVLIVLPVVTYVLIEVVSIPSQIQSSVQAYLSNYTVKVTQ